MKKRADAIFKDLNRDVPTINTILAVDKGSSDDSSSSRNDVVNKSRIGKSTNGNSDRRKRLMDGLKTRGIADDGILNTLNVLDDDRVVSIVSHFNARLQNTSKGGKVRNPRNFLKSMLRRVEMDVSGKYTKYDLSNVDDMTSGSNSRAAAAFFSEIRSKKRSREDSPPPPPPCSRGAVKFKAPSSLKKKSKIQRKTKKRKRNHITLSHLEEEDDE